MISAHGDEEDGFYNVHSSASDDNECTISYVDSPLMQLHQQTSTQPPTKQIKLNACSARERSSIVSNDNGGGNSSRSTSYISSMYIDDTGSSRCFSPIASSLPSSSSSSSDESCTEPDNHSWITRCSLGMLSLTSIVSFLTAMGMVFTSPIHYAIMLALKCTVGHLCCPVSIVRPIRNVLLTPIRWARIALCGIGHVCCWDPHSIWPTNDTTHTNKY